MRATLAPILVLGLGNDILTDDAVGLQVAAAVRERLAGDEHIEVKSTTEMGLALLDEIAGRVGVVLVDSVQTGGAPPGHVHEFDVAALPAVTRTVPHMLGIGDALALGRLMGLPMPGHVRIFAVEVADPFTLGTEMTGPVRAAVPAAAEKVIAAAQELAKDDIRAATISVGG